MEARDHVGHHVGDVGTASRERWKSPCGKHGQKPAMACDGHVKGGLTTPLLVTGCGADRARCPPMVPITPLLESSVTLPISPIGDDILSDDEGWE